MIFNTMFFRYHIELSTQHESIKVLDFCEKRIITRQPMTRENFYVLG